MKAAAIYCRVSTDNQETEGTSLQTQLEACLAKAKELGYDVPPDNIMFETYSGLSIDRPKLVKLREWVCNKQIDAIIAYTLDRVSRDPVHCIIIQDELEKHGIEFILVTETLDSSDMGKLMMYVKGYAAKLEAQKILERTTRGRRERVKAGKLPTGRGVLYGYDYNKETGTNKANNYLDIVRMAGEWILEDGIALNEVCRRLMALGIPAPKFGLQWSRGTVGRIFRNPVYAGKSYAYRTVTNDNKRRVNTPEKLVEIPNAVDRAAFTWDEWQAIQDQLDRNRELSPRNQKLEYLLRGRVYCKQCGRKYYGIPQHGKPYYRCNGRIKLNNTNCINKVYNGKKLEASVWHEVRSILLNPKLVLAEISRQRETGDDIADLERQLQAQDKRLKVLDTADTRNMRLYTSGLWAYEKLEKETQRIRNEQVEVKKTIQDIERRIDSTREQGINEAGIVEICELLSKNLEQFNTADKQLALDTLNIKVYIDNSKVSIEGTLPVNTGITASQPS